MGYDDDQKSARMRPFSSHTRISVPSKSVSMLTFDGKYGRSDVARRAEILARFGFSVLGSAGSRKNASIPFLNDW